MAKKTPAGGKKGGKVAAGAGQSKKQKLQDRQQETLRREQKQVLSSDKTNQTIMMDQIVEWCESHPYL